MSRRRRPIGLACSDYQAARYTRHYRGRRDSIGVPIEPDELAGPFDPMAGALSEAWHQARRLGCFDGMKLGESCRLSLNELVTLIKGKVVEDGAE